MRISSLILFTFLTLTSSLMVTAMNQVGGHGGHAGGHGGHAEGHGGHVGEHSESGSRHPPSGASTSRLWIYYFIMLNHPGYHDVREHGSSNNITLSSNCSKSVNFLLDISGENRTINLSPNSSLLIHVEDSECRNYTGFRINANNTDSNCTLVVDYSFLPCEDADFPVIGIIAVLLFAIVISVLIGVAIAIPLSTWTRSKLRRRNYTEYP